MMHTEPTPTESDNRAQGRATHPGLGRPDEPNAEGVLQCVTRLYNLVEIDVIVCGRYPGCATRPWASM